MKGGSNNDIDSFVGEVETDRLKELAYFDSLMAQYDVAVRVLEKLAWIADETGDFKVKQLIRQEIAGVRASKERILRLREVVWND